MADQTTQGELATIQDEGETIVKRGRRFVFTINNYHADDVTWFKSQTQHNMLIAGEEVGEEGTAHIQGAVAWTTAVRFGQVQSWWNTRYAGANQACKIWVRNMKGSPKQSQKYCSKEGKVIIHYNKLKQGDRQDLTDLWEDIQQGKRWKGLVEDDEHRSTAARYHKFVDKAIGIAEESGADANRSVRVMVIYGEAGLGKTGGPKKCYKDDIYQPIVGANTVWFDGYKGQSVLLIDDFYGGIKYSYLMKLLDRGKLMLEVKGSTTYAKWNKVIITSNVHPSEWYKTVKDQQGLRRRCTESDGMWRLTWGEDALKVEQADWFMDTVDKTVIDWKEAVENQERNDAGIPTRLL